MISTTYPATIQNCSEILFSIHTDAVDAGISPSRFYVRRATKSVCEISDSQYCHLDIVVHIVFLVLGYFLLNVSM